MSLRVADFGGDGDADVLYSDRRGSDLDGNSQLDDGIAMEEDTRHVRGIFRIENLSGQWIKHVVQRSDSEIMFLKFRNYDNDGDDEFVAAVKSNAVLLLERRQGVEFILHEVRLPERGSTPRRSLLAM